MKMTHRPLYFLVAMAGLLFGYNIGIISGAIHFINVNLGIRNNSFEEGFVVSSILIGAAIGALISGKLSNAFGRKPLLVIYSILFCCGALISSFAQIAGVLSLGRIILGFAIGSLSAIAPMYFSELAPQDRRGAIAFLNQLMIVLGILLSYVTNLCFVWFASSLWNEVTGWRIALSVAIVPALILIFSATFLPESPNFLVRKNRITEASDVLERIRPASHIETEISELKSFLTERTSSFREAFSKYSRPAVLVALLLALFQQLMGCNTVIYYTPKILELLGFDIFGQRLVLVATGVFNVLATIIAIFIVNKINHRTLFFVGGVAMAVSMGLVALFDYSGRSAALEPGFLVLGAVALILFIVSFGITWGGIMWIVLGETLPAHVRTMGVTISQITNWIANFAVCLFFPVLIGIAGADTHFIFIGFATICLLSVLFTKFALFETNDKTDEEIESIVAARVKR